MFCLPKWSDARGVSGVLEPNVFGLWLEMKDEEEEDLLKWIYLENSDEDFAMNKDRDVSKRCSLGGRIWDSFWAYIFLNSPGTFK